MPIRKNIMRCACIGVLGGGAEEDCQQELRVAGRGVRCFRRNDLLQVPLGQLVDDFAAVDHVPGQTVEEPAKDALDLGRPYLLHELTEDGPTRFSGRRTFLVLRRYLHAAQGGELAEFIQPCWNRKRLPVFGVRRSTGVQDDRRAYRM